MSRLVVLLFCMQSVLSFGVFADTKTGIDISHWQGSWQQGGMVWGYLEPGQSLWLDDDSIPVADDGLFVFGFGRDASSPVSLTIQDGEQTLLSTQVEITPQKYRIQRVEGVPQRTVTPSEEHLERIRREAALVRDARKESLPFGLFTEPFIWPTKGPITGVFGSQRVYNGVPGRPHYGVDVGVPKGTAVLSPADGVVTLAENDLFYSGGTIIIDHGLGVSSSMLHLSKVDVEIGQKISQGEKIGEVGATGRATGPHLDWRMNWRNTRIDPLLIVGPMPEKTP